MTGVDPARLEALFHAALERPGAEREAILAAAAREDAALAGEARRLLDALEGDAGFLEAPATMPEPAAPPRFVGRYELLEVIGEGGMGIVHLARQQAPRRLVAVKLLRPGFVTETAARRLAAEAEILGRLDHPGIARILEAGSATIDGRAQPFVAMERVEGRDILEHAAALDLDRGERLRLLAEFADAIEHAHRQGVVHRDLKPAHLLVDRRGRPRVLDFGIARLVDETARRATLTGTGRIAGTLPYMAPEALGGGSGATDPRCDVYALGVVLYELLAGRRPHDLDALTLPEAIRVACEQEAPRLGGLVPDCRGDVEAIVATALERDPRRRYASAGSLAADLRRHLEGRPVLARPPSLTATLGRIARRRRGAIAGGAALVVALLATAMAGREAAQVRAREATVAAGRALTRELVAALEDPDARFDPAIEPRLRAASAALPAAHADDPLEEARLRELIGDAWLRLARPQEAEVAYARAATLREARLGRDDPETLDALAGLAAARGRLASDPAAQEAAGLLLEEVFERRRRALGDDDRRTLRSMNDLAMHRLSRGDAAAEALLAEAVAGMRRSVGDDDRDTLTAIANLGHRYELTERLAEAEPLLRQAMEGFARRYGEREPRTLLATEHVARLLRRLGRPDEAEPLYRRVTEGLLRVLGPAHPSTIIARTNFAGFLRETGRDDEALALLEETQAVAIRELGAGDELAGRVRQRYGEALAAGGRRGEAIAVLRTQRDAFAEALGADHPRTQRAGRALRRVEEAAAADESGS